MGPLKTNLTKPEVADDTQQKTHQRGHRQREERVYAKTLGRQETRVHADHQKFAMGKIHNVHDTENDGQTQGHQGQDHADEQARKEGTEEDVHSIF